MPWVLMTLTAVLVVLVVRAVVSGRLTPGALPPPVTSTPKVELPESPRAQDVAGIRFDTAPIGYAVSEVDDALDELQARLAAQEKEIREWPSR